MQVTITRRTSHRYKKSHLCGKRRTSRVTISQRMLTLELIIHRPAKIMLTPFENAEEDDITIARRRLKIAQKVCKERRPCLQR